MNDWFSRLRQEIAALRHRKPFPSIEDLTDAEEWQRRIIGGSVIAWLEQHSPAILRERQVLHKVMNVDPDPGIVFTSNIPGLLAADEIIGSNGQEVVFLHEKEYKRWLRKNPDKEYRWHVHFWSIFHEPKLPARIKMMYPLNDGSSYWQHSEGTNWGALAGRGVDHLWQWDGVEPKLLEEGFQSWVS